MDINRLLKIVTALCIWAVCLMFIARLIGNEFFAVQMTFYAISIVVMIVIFYKLFREMLSKDRSGLPVYNYSKEQTVSILISPSRVTFLCLVMILLSAAVIAFMLSGSVIQHFDWALLESYVLLIPCIVVGFIFLKGVQLWARRNKVVQLRFTPVGLEYMPVDVTGTGRGRGASILSMYFRKKMTSINYEDIRTIVIDKNKWRGDLIQITTTCHQLFYLPFLADDKNQFEAVYAALMERWNQGAGNSRP